MRELSALGGQSIGASEFCLETPQGLVKYWPGRFHVYTE